MTKSIFSPAHTETLLSDLRRANTEQAKKELLLQYLTKVFVSDGGAQRLIRALAHGAERTIANIPRGVGTGKGRADTQTDTIIIEWEKDLSRTGAHAVDQLREYLVGNWKSGQEFRFVLVATDGIRWRTYAPDWSHLSKSFSLNSDFELREIKRFDLDEKTVESFPLFLDEILFVSHRKIATLERIESDFGNTSITFINSLQTLKKTESFLKKESELKVAYEQWRKFLSVAYGRFDDSPAMFLVHTYLSVFAKLLAFHVISRRHIADDATLKKILNGSLFEEELLVERFVEDDFFHWVAAPDHFSTLKPMFRELTRQIEEYDFSEVKEDILKGVYQELIDLDTRHALGEYFTPDWLCEKIVDEIEINKETRILDPACGSGSFLRAAISKMRAEYPKVTAEELAAQICGIDIHPLSVQIAKTTLLLSIGDLVARAKRPITLNIYLANSLLVPAETADLFKSTFRVSIDNKQYAFNVSGVIQQEQFDALISLCDDLAKRYAITLQPQKFNELARQTMPRGHGVELPGQLYDIYRGLKAARDAGRDSIWKFILQNTYKPVFLKNRFDVIVGNPPWLTYADISNADYQLEVKRLADEYKVTPPHLANMPHLEIAAVFLAHAVNYFLRPSGVLAFVLPRSFISADQHEQTRSGRAMGVKIRSVWDLMSVSPLFRVPSCVFFAVAGGEREHGIPTKGIAGKIFSGKLPKAQTHWGDVRARLKIEDCRWYYSVLQAGKKRSKSALTNNPSDGLVGQNYYADRFKQGATIVPRSFYFVESADPESKMDLDDAAERVYLLKASSSMLRDAKAPWKDLSISGKLEGCYLFRTAVAKNMLPFALVSPLLVALPILIEEGGGGERRFALVDHDDMLKIGRRFGSIWFSSAERLWNANRTEKSAREKMSYLNRLDFQHGISDQEPDSRYLVLYTASATDASAAVVDRDQFDLPFVVESKTYWCSVKSRKEADYLCAYLNSGYANSKIKDFQSRGLFGPRDIHKTIVKLPFPKFDSKESDHAELADLGNKCADISAKALRFEQDADFEPRALGRIRSKLRDHLERELEKIDLLVEKISTGKSEAAIRASGKGRSRRRGGTLRMFE